MHTLHRAIKTELKLLVNCMFFSGENVYFGNCGIHTDERIMLGGEGFVPHTRANEENTI